MTSTLISVLAFLAFPAVALVGTLFGFGPHLEEDNGVLLIIAVVSSVSAIASPLLTVYVQSKVQQSNKQDHGQSIGEIREVKQELAKVVMELRSFDRRVEADEQIVEGELRAVRDDVSSVYSAVEQVRGTVATLSRGVNARLEALEVDRDQ